jgi:glutamate:GABA antiporter
VKRHSRVSDPGLEPSSIPTGTGVSLAEAADPNRPKRVMGFRDLLLFYVVTGISLRWIATAAAAGPSAIVIWIGAWLAFYTPLALSVIELSSRYPNEGGLYVWSKRAFGDFSGFMAAWTYWTSNLPYFPAVLYFAASNLLFMRQAQWGYLSANPTFYIVFALLTLTAATLLNVVGLGVGKWLHNIGALAMWIPVLIVIGMGLLAYHRFGSATTFSIHTMTPSIRLNVRWRCSLADSPSRFVTSSELSACCWRCLRRKSAACKDWYRRSRKLPIASARPASFRSRRC